MAWQTQETYDAIRGRRVLGNREGEEEFDGSPFTISDAGTLDCALPDVTYFAQQGEDGGAYLVAWQQQEGVLGIGPLTDLMMRAVLATGEFGGDPAVLCSADENQTEVAFGFGPAITATLAAWTDERAGNPDVRARLIERDGGLGRDMLVHPAPGDQQEPQVAYNPDDDEYLVVWHDYRHGAGNADVFAQRVSGAGVPIGENVAVTVAAGHQRHPQVAYATVGDVYLVAWEEGLDIRAQRLSRQAAPVGNAFDIAASANDERAPIEIEYNGGIDRFFVLWNENQPDPARQQVWGAHVSSGGAVGSEVHLSWGLWPFVEDYAAAAYNPDSGEYLVVWQLVDDTDDYSVMGRRVGYDANMDTYTIYPELIDIAVLYGSDQQAPDVVYQRAAGRYVVVWQDDRGGNADVYGRLVSPDGTLDGSGYAIASESQEETLPRLSADGTWPSGSVPTPAGPAMTSTGEGCGPTGGRRTTTWPSRWWKRPATRRARPSRVMEPAAGWWRGRMTATGTGTFTALPCGTRGG